MIAAPSNSTLVTKHDVDSLACLTGNSVYDNIEFLREGFKISLIYDILEGYYYTRCFYFIS